MIGNTILENVKEYKYLGITFTKLNNFRITKTKLCQQATKAMYFVLSKAKDNNLSTECKLKLFDSIVLPIMLYGCEIWGHEKIDICNSIQIHFLRHILPVKKSTPFFMLFGELGRLPVEIIIYRRMVCYWARLLSGNQLKFSALLYKVMFNDYIVNGTEYKWIITIKTILDNLGMGNIWLSQTFTSVNCLSQHIKQRQCDQYLQIWRSNMSLSSRGKTYQIYKEQISLERYFNLLPDKLWKPILKFRTSNYYLPIETGRWNKIPLEDRICTLCNENDIADEFHYLLKCQFFNHPRTQFLHPYYYTRPNTYKFKYLMQSQRISTLKKIANFINIIMNVFKHL